MLFMFCSCYQDCKNENMPSKEVNCSISHWSAELSDFLFFYDSTSRLKNLTIVVHREQLMPDDLISFYDLNSSLAIYKVKEVNPNYYLIETHIPVGPLISWQPKVKEFRLKICNRNIEIYSSDNGNFANKPSGILAIL